MDKLKKSAVAKVVAAILLSVSLFMAAVSSCVVVAAISYGGSSQMQAEAIYDGYMRNLVDNSSYQVDEYYKAYVESQDDTQENHTIRYYRIISMRKTAISTSRSYRMMQRSIQPCRIIRQKSISIMT